jgi:hypothetical protein
MPTLKEISAVSELGCLIEPVLASHCWWVLQGSTRQSVIERFGAHDLAISAPTIPARTLFHPNEGRYLGSEHDRTISVQDSSGLRAECSVPSQSPFVTLTSQPWLDTFAAPYTVRRQGPRRNTLVPAR